MTNNIGCGRPRTVQRTIAPIVEQLRLTRISKGLSQEKLAKKLGYSVDSLKRWEVGRHPPTFTHLIEWADFLGFDLRLVNNGKDALKEAISYPDKQQLMGGR